MRVVGGANKVLMYLLQKKTLNEGQIFFNVAVAHQNTANTYTLVN